jgi:hypothetical protein
MSYSTMNHIGKVAPDPEMLTFGDEAAKDKRTLIRQHGRSRIGLGMSPPSMSYWRQCG